LNYAKIKIQNTSPYKIYLIKAQNLHVGDEIKFGIWKKKKVLLYIIYV